MPEGPTQGSGYIEDPENGGKGRIGASHQGQQTTPAPNPADSLQPLPQWGMVTPTDGAGPSAGAKPTAGDGTQQRSSPMIPALSPSAERPIPDRQVPADGQPHRRSPLIFLIGGLALLVLGAAGYAALTRQSDDGDPVAGLDSEETASTSASPAEEIQLLLQGIGYEAIEVVERDGTIYVSGPLESQSDMAAVVTASASLSGGLPINTDGLSIGPAEPAAPETQQAREPDASSAGTLSVQADPLQRLQVVISRTVAATPIIFGPGTSTVADWHGPALDQVADLLLANPGIAVAAIGYTDESGPAEDNRTLSLERAESVREYLIDKGVSPGLIQTEARGESEATGLQDVGYLERRVEFEVVAASASPPVVRPLDVGIIVPSARDDLAFSQSLVDALDVLNEERGGLTVDITDNMFDPDEGREQARRYAADGSDVVILHGAQFLSLVDELAQEFPDVFFVAGPDGHDSDLPNVFVYVVFAEQGAYVMGDLAASLSGSDTVGIIGPIQTGEPQRYVDGFRAGAEAGGATVLSEYVGSFADVAAAAALAESHSQDGADVLTGTAQLVVGAIEVASQHNLPWFANQSDPRELAPDNVVAAQVYHFEVALREILAEIDANAPAGGAFPLTLGNGGMLLEFNPQFNLDRALRRRADGLLFDITAGALNVEVDVGQ